MEAATRRGRSVAYGSVRDRRWWDRCRLWFEPFDLTVFLIFVAFPPQRHLLPFQMGQGEYGPDGPVQPGRPRPYYTHYRKLHQIKKIQGSQFGLDFTDNEDDDSCLQEVSAKLCCQCVFSLLFRLDQQLLLLIHLASPGACAALIVDCICNISDINLLNETRDQMTLLLSFSSCTIQISYNRMDCLTEPHTPTTN